MQEGYSLNASPANIYLFKINNRNARKRRVIISKLTMKAPEHDVVLASLLLTLNIFHTLSSVSSVDFEQVNLSWVASG